MKRVGKVMSIIGLILRKTIYKILLTVAAAFGLFWVLPPNAVTIIALLLVMIIIILPFEWKGRHAMYTMKRFAFSRSDLKLIFGATAFLELNFSILLLKIAYLLLLGMEYGFSSLGVSTGVTAEIREAGILFGAFPSISPSYVIVKNLLILVAAVFIAEVTNREGEK